MLWKILSQIFQRINNSGYYSILFDETTDLSHTSQLSLTVRYIHDGTVREDFLKFVDPHAEAYGSGREENESVTDGLSDDKMVTEGESSTSVHEKEPTLMGTVLGNLVLVGYKEYKGHSKGHSIA